MTRARWAVLAGALMLCAAGAAPARAQDDVGGGWRLGAFTFKPIGFVKLDAIYDFDPIGSRDSFDPRTIPVDGSEGRNVRLHARQTRLGLDVRGTVEREPMQIYVELDFFEGASYALRLRHAYGEWRGWRAGRAWSLFVDEDALPSTLDFESPTTFPQVRQAQIRYTHRLTETWSWAVSAEDPAHTLDLPPTGGVTAREERIAPDVMGRVKHKTRTRHFQGAVFVGATRARFDDNDTTTRALWGVMASGRVALGPRDAVMAQVSGGAGIGRFRGTQAAFLSPDGVLHTIDIFAVAAALDHHWSPRVMSTFTVGFANADAEDDPAVADPTDQLYYASANLVYWWMPDRAFVGGEYLFGRRETLTRAAGDANRLQVAFKFLLP